MKTMFICSVIALTISYSVLAEKAGISNQKKQVSSGIIQGNPLHGATYEELNNVYRGSEAKHCIDLNRFLSKPLPTRYGERKRQIDYARSQKKWCQNFVKHTPYTLKQVIDPKAIARYFLGRRLETCRKYGEVLRKSAKCDQLESQQ